MILNHECTKCSFMPLPYLDFQINHFGFFNCGKCNGECFYFLNIMFIAIKISKPIFWWFWCVPTQLPILKWAKMAYEFSNPQLLHRNFSLQMTLNLQNVSFWSWIVQFYSGKHKKQFVVYEINYSVLKMWLKSTNWID